MKKQLPKVLFIIPNLDRGGSEKVFITLIQSIDFRKFDVTVVVVTRPGVYYDQIPNQIQKILLGKHRVKFAAFALGRLIHKMRPDIVFTFNVNHLNLIVIPLLIALRFRGAFVTRESSVLSLVTAKKGILRRSINTVYQNLFRQANRVIAQSLFTANDLKQNFDVRTDQIVVINNPIKFDHIHQAARSKIALFPLNTINLLAVGRLSYVKGFDMLIKALSLMPDNYYLTILGGETYEHPEYTDELFRLVDILKVSSRINFAGFQSNPYPYMQQADLLIVTSHYEGFPNVAVESMALGTPVIAFDSPGGHNDLIKNGENGWLVPFGNLEALANTVVQASDVVINQSVMKQNIRDKYDVRSVILSYESLLLELSNN